MSYVLRYALILQGSLMIFAGLAWFFPDFLPQVWSAFRDGPRLVRTCYNERDRSDELEHYNQKLIDRRAKASRIVKAICNEEIGVCEGVVRQDALEKDFHLPKLIFAHVPKSKWPELQHICLIELVADELRNDPDKAQKLLPKLLKEVQDKFGLAEPPSLEIFKREKSNHKGGVPVRRRVRLTVE